MSSNKSKYFLVTTTTSVRANNMTEARRAATSRSRIPQTEVLAQVSDVERLPASKARSLAESLKTSN